jgi:hypothetical protein
MRVLSRRETNYSTQEHQALSHAHKSMKSFMCINILVPLNLCMIAVDGCAVHRRPGWWMHAAALTEPTRQRPTPKLRDTMLRSEALGLTNRFLCL